MATFSKAERFPKTKPVDVPPVGTYDPIYDNGIVGPVTFAQSARTTITGFDGPAVGEYDPKDQLRVIGVPDFSRFGSRSHSHQDISLLNYSSTSVTTSTPLVKSGFKMPRPPEVSDVKKPHAMSSRIPRAGGKGAVGSASNPDLTAEIESLRNQLVQKNGELVNMTSEKNAVEMELKALRATLIERDHHTASAPLCQSVTVMDSPQLRSEVVRLRRQLQRLEELDNRVLAAMNDSAQGFQMYKAQRDEFMEQANRVTSNLEADADARVELESRIAQLEKERDSLLQEIDRLNVDARAVENLLPFVTEQRSSLLQLRQIVEESRSSMSTSCTRLLDNLGLLADRCDELDSKLNHHIIFETDVLKHHAALEKECHDLLHVLRLFEREYHARMNVMVHLDGEYKQTQLQLREAQAVSLKAASDADVLRIQLAITEREVVTLHQALTASESKSKYDHEMNASREAAIAAELQNWSAKVEDLQQTNAQLSLELNIQQQVANGQSFELAKQTTMSTQLEQQMSNTKKCSMVLQAAVASLKQERDMLGADLSKVSESFKGDTALLGAQIQILSSTAVETQSRVQELSMEKVELSSQLLKLEAEFVQMQDACAMEKSRVVLLTEQLAYGQAQLESLESSVVREKESWQREVQHLQSVIAALNAEVNEMKRSEKLVLAEKNSSEELYRKSESERTRLVIDLKLAHQLAEHRMEHVQSLERQLGSVSDCLQQTRAAAAQWSDQVVELKGRAGELEAELTQATARAAVADFLETKLQDLVEQVAALSAQTDSTRDKLQIAEEERTAAQRCVATLRTACDHLSAQNERFQREMQEISASQVVSNEWREKYEHLQRLIEPFKLQINEYETERDALMTNSEDWEKALKELSDKYANILSHQNNKQKIKHVVQLKEELHSLRTENAKLRPENVRLKQKMLDLEARLRQAEGRRKFQPSQAFAVAGKENNPNTQGPLKLMNS